MQPELTGFALEMAELRNDIQRWRIRFLAVIPMITCASYYWLILVLLSNSCMADKAAGFAANFTEMIISGVAVLDVFHAWWAHRLCG